MGVVEKMILGVVQSVTEFLPVSSSGHLVFLKYLFKLHGHGAFYEVFLHSATFLSVVIVLRDKIFDREKFLRYAWLSILATVPLFFIAPFADTVESFFDKPQILPLTFSITSLILFSSYFVRSPGRKATWKDAIAVGIAQVLALLPGVSRSGTTITAGLYRGLDSEEAFTLSFWMFLPAALGSFILEVQKVSSVQLSLWDGLVWMVTFLVGIVSLIFLRKMLTRGSFWMFGFYSFAMAILSAYMFWMR